MTESAQTIPLNLKLRKEKAMSTHVYPSLYTKHVVRLSYSKQSFSHDPAFDFQLSRTCANTVHLCSTLEGQ